jgi:hypothetical protein
MNPDICLAKTENVGTPLRVAMGRNDLKVGRKKHLSGV